MKMVKSLLLGTAAGLVAMTGAQAADLPVKAKPVQYVKICSLYGAGFYYIPGTDMCLKVGGWVRQYMDYNANSSLTSGPMINNVNTRSTQNFVARVRGYITADARNQTEFGTLRSYIAVGLSATNTTGASNDAASGASGFSSNRAFIQIAGFTFGLSQSFYDFFPTPALSFFGGNIFASSDTSDGGKTVTAYTAQFGNGLSATVSAEGVRATSVYSGAGVIGSTAVAVAPATFNAGSLAPTAARGAQMPDFVANLRLDQPWGSAQIMGAIHDVSGAYYGASQDTGNPSNTLGWAVGAGLRINAPQIGPGDYFDVQVNYAQGASGYTNNAGGAYAFFKGGVGGSYGMGVITDGVYGGSVALGTATGVNLTTAWGVQAAYEHFWSKSWQTSLYGGYIATSYNTQANAILCAGEAAGGFTGAGAGAGSAAVAAAGCNNNNAQYIIGSRTQFNIDSSTYLGVDIAYLGLKSGTMPAGTPVPASGAQPAGVRAIQDQNTWVGQFRIHRNFYP
ncbi:MAG: porin [Pseudolabrys sp.]